MEDQLEYVVHLFARLAPIGMSQSVLINNISASELSRKFIKCALLVGKEVISPLTERKNYANGFFFLLSPLVLIKPSSFIHFRESAKVFFFPSLSIESQGGKKKGNLFFFFLGPYLPLSTKIKLKIQKKIWEIRRGRRRRMESGFVRKKLDPSSPAAKAGRERKKGGKFSGLFWLARS